MLEYGSLASWNFYPKPEPSCAPRGRRITRLATMPEAEAEWSRHIEKLAEGMFYIQIDSWATGINFNAEGTEHTAHPAVPGWSSAYWARCDEVAANGYTGMVLDHSPPDR